jgi:hypothetical protein
MTQHTASRTLVKSPPELWAECSDASALTRHLDQFGDIKITRLEPETTVAWEGEQVRGTVRLEPSGWGTKVTLTAVAEEMEPAAVEAEPVAVEAEPAAVEPEPVAVEPEKRPGLFARLLAMLVGKPEPEPEIVLRELTAVDVAEPKPVAVEPEPVTVEPEPVAVEPEPVVVAPQPVALDGPPPLGAELADAEAALTAALESLGQAHHRPFSRG